MASVITRMSKNAGNNSATKTGKGHFAAAAQRIAKLRSGNLQHGVPKRAPLGGPQAGHSTGKIPSKKVQASEAQTALNPEQQGPTNDKAQTGGRKNQSLFLITQADLPDIEKKN